jgi:hypothetical protein
MIGQVKMQLLKREDDRWIRGGPRWPQDGGCSWLSAPPQGRCPRQREMETRGRQPARAPAAAHPSAFHLRPSGAESTLQGGGGTGVGGDLAEPCILAIGWRVSEGQARGGTQLW